jgi:uncharacterized membrane protein YkvA (DUF1232 family)
MAEFPDHEMPEWGPDLAPPRVRRSKRAVVGEVLLSGPHLAKLVFRLLRDPRVSRRRKLVLAGALAYVVSPVDLIPGKLFPIIGQLDDALVAAFSVDYLMRGVEPGVLAELWDGSEDGLEMVMALVEWGSEFVPSSLKRLIESTS